MRARKVAATVGFLLGLPVVLVTIWWLATLGPTNFFVPKPGVLVETFGQVWFSPRLLTDVLPSVGRMLVGLLVAIVLGIALGLAIGSLRWLRELLEPLLEFFRAVPPPVLIPVLMLLLGVTDEMKIVTIVSGCVWPVLLNTVEGVRSVDSVLGDSARVYGIGGAPRLRYLVLRSASPQIMAGVRQSLSLALILMVISEMFASSAGLGYAIVEFQRSFAIPAMWSGIALLGIIGVLMSVVFQAIERRVLRWYHGQKEAERAR